MSLYARLPQAEEPHPYAVGYVCPECLCDPRHTHDRGCPEARADGAAFADEDDPAPMSGPWVEDIDF